MEKKCKYCKVKIFVPKCLSKRKKYCSKKCFLDDTKGIYKNCTICNKKIYVIPARLHEKKFCSRKCAGKFKSTMLRELSGAWKGGRYQSKGYFHVLKPDHPNSNYAGYMLEHRLIMEEKIGRYLTTEEEVHHRDEDPSNNKLSNLIILSHLDHRRLHNGWKKKKDGWYKTCCLCKKNKKVDDKNFYIYTNYKRKMVKSFSSHCKKCNRKKTLLWFQSKFPTQSLSKISYLKQHPLLKKS